MKRALACLAAACLLTGCAAVSHDNYARPVVVPVLVGGAQPSMRSWVERYAQLVAIPTREARQYYRQRRKELATYECGEGAVEILMLLTRPDLAADPGLSESRGLLDGCEDKPGWVGSDVSVLAPLLLKQAALVAQQAARERDSAQELTELRRQIQALKEIERSLQR
ncbi:MAG: hypothetical protein V4457_00850 [Pseudomonadota bacterium]